MIGAVLLLAVLLAGCGSFGQSIRDTIDEDYPLKDVVESSTNSDDEAFVYVAKKKNLDDVSKALQEKKSPDKVSEKNEGRQVLVYEDYFVTLMNDEDNPDNTLIEVANYGFVRENYRPSFFQGLLAMSLLNNFLGVNNWGSRQQSRCRASAAGCYGGYAGSGGNYKGPTTVPSFRKTSPRGGGPGAGK
jgi:hypothetical protein